MRWLLRLAMVLFALAAVPAQGQSIIERLVTPGPLSSAHAKLESSCNSCHSNFRKEAQNGKCLACHKGIATDMRGGAGYHGKAAAARTSACKTCHSEHKGRGAALVRFSRTGFNHDLTDFPLRGGHAKLTCATCHGPGRSYRAAPTTCAVCHKLDDPHRGQLGARCQNCHVVEGWTRLKPFDHARTGFRLTGAHRTASCMGCHAGQRWKGLGDSCVSCHAKDDAHKGTRGTNCASCHTTADWKQATFDHDSTGFSLVGAHAEAACASCHGVNMATRNPSRSCYACHAKEDTHKGANGTECQSCHNPRSWRSVTFDHDRLTEFPLRGAHRTTGCSECHVKPPKEAKPPTTCIGCHQEDDSHEGANGTECERCHTESDWKKVDFDHAKMTSFPLLGAHARIKCEACHTAPSDEVQLIAQCAACHLEDDAHKGTLGPDCGRCHDSVDWKNKVRFDHDLSRFPLHGKHEGLECVACHADKTFATKGIGCADCHEDTHHLGALGKPAACATCHNSFDWKSWRFDHDTQTDYPLTGKHQGLVCSSCHARPGNPSELSTACYDCHRRDDIHRGGFGSDCARCHSTSDFKTITMQKR